MKIAVICVGVACIAVLIGIIRDPPPTPPANKVWSVTAIDNSPGCRAQTPADAFLLSRYVARMPPTDRWTFLLLNASVEEQYDGQGGGGEERIQDIIRDSLGRGANRTGTFPGALWPRIASTVAKAEHPVVILVFTDGDNDSAAASSRSAIKTAAESLASNSHVKSVTIAGVNPENRDEIRALFCPLGDRLRILGSVSGADLTALKNQLKAARV